MSFEDDLKAESEVVKPTRDVDVSLNGNLHTIRFTQMDGTDWAAATDQAPARPGVLLDMRYGYNLRQLVYVVAPKSGKRVVGAEEVALTEDQWRLLLKSLKGGPMMRLGDALFILNEYEPDEEVAAAKKASAVAPALNSD